MLLELDDISAGYGNGPDVIKGVSMQLDRGEMMAVLGANGAGKTTLLRVLSGLLALRKGRIMLNGADISRMSASRRVASGLVHVPEGRQMLAGLSVEENLMLGGYVRRGEPQELGRTAQEVYSMFPILLDRRAQRAGSLSGGQQQMLAIGRALMAGPKVLMCDEPSLGLAPLIVTEIFETIGKLRDRGIPILLVEQNARRALAMADRGLVLKRGVVTVTGSASELQADPEVSAAYLGALQGAAVGVNA